MNEDSLPARYARLSPAGRMQMVMDLLSPRPIFDDEGRFVREDPPILQMTAEEVIEMLEAP